MTNNEIKDIIQLIARSGMCEFQLEIKGFSIKTKNPRPRNEMRAAGEPIISTVIELPSDAQLPGREAEATSENKLSTHPDESNFILVKSPMVGTFYRAPGAGNSPFVTVGDNVKKGQPLCTIGAMKLFYEIESEVSGKIIKILFDDASPVEYDAHLFLIDPS